MTRNKRVTFDWVGKSLVVAWAQDMTYRSDLDISGFVPNLMPSTMTFVLDTLRCLTLRDLVSVGSIRRGG